MINQIKREIAILLAVCFVVSLTAVAVSAGTVISTPVQSGGSGSVQIAPVSTDGSGNVVSAPVQSGGSGSVQIAPVSTGGTKTSSATNNGQVMSSTSTNGATIDTSIINGVVTTKMTSTVVVKKGETYNFVLNTAGVNSNEWKIQSSKGLKLDPSSTLDVKKFVAIEKGDQYVIADYQSAKVKTTLKTIVKVV